jgi:hypothetical protein
MRARLLIFVFLVTALAPAIGAGASQGEPTAPAPAAAPAQAPQAAPAQAPEAAAAAKPDSTLPEATPHSFSAAAVPDKVKLGEQLLLTVEVRDQKSERYELTKDFGLGADFDLVKVDASRRDEGEETVTRFEIRAALFDLGEKKLPDIVLQVNGPSGARRLTVPGPTVTGVGVLDDNDAQAGLMDILPPVEVKVPHYGWLWALAGGLLAAALALLLWRWLKNRPRRIATAPPAPALPAHVRALQALESLQREDLPSQGRGKELFFRLSEILRGYLGERFGFDAIDMTTEELLGALTRMRTPGLDYARFEALCREGDLIRFAKTPATATDCKVALESAFALVHATAPHAVGKAEAAPSAGEAA